MPAQWNTRKGFSEDRKGPWMCALHRWSPEWATFTSTFSPREVSGQGQVSGQEGSPGLTGHQRIPRGRTRRSFMRQPLRKAIFKVTVVPCLRTDAQTRLWTVVL